jgi:hypothetical protein
MSLFFDDEAFDEFMQRAYRVILFQIRFEKYLDLLDLAIATMALESQS